MYKIILSYKTLTFKIYNKINQHYIVSLVLILNIITAVIRIFQSTDLTHKKYIYKDKFCAN